MNNDLNSLILSNARETVAKENGYADWIHLCISCEKIVISEFSKQAALLAMEELAGFYRWVCGQGFIQNHFNDLWWKSAVGTYNEYTESELYTQYLNEKKDE